MYTAAKKNRSKPDPMRTGDSTQNKAPSAKNTTKGNKRELSSPIQQDLQTKKSRSRTCSDSDSIAELNEASTELSDFRAVMQDTETETSKQDGVATYYLSRPMMPDDVCSIAQELKTLMLPEVRASVKAEIKEELAGFGSMLDKAVASINKTLNYQISSLKTENKELKTRVSQLESRAKNNKKARYKGGNGNRCTVTIQPTQLRKNFWHQRTPRRQRRKRNSERRH